MIQIPHRLYTRIARLGCARPLYVRESLAQRLPLRNGELAEATEKVKATGTGKKEATCIELTTLGSRVCLGYASQLVDEVGV